MSLDSTHSTFNIQKKKGQKEGYFDEFSLIVNFIIKILETDWIIFSGLLFILSLVSCCGSQTQRDLY